MGNGKKMYLLILSQDPKVTNPAREMIESQLSVEPVCWYVETAEEALEIYKTQPLTACIIDVDVPGATELMVVITEDKADLYIMTIGSMNEEEFIRDFREEAIARNLGEDMPVS